MTSDSIHDLLRRKIGTSFRPGMTERDMWAVVAGELAKPGDTIRDLVAQITPGARVGDSLWDLLRKLVPDSPPLISVRDLVAAWVALPIGEGLTVDSTGLTADSTSVTADKF